MKPRQGKNVEPETFMHNQPPRGEGWESPQRQCADYSGSYVRRVGSRERLRACGLSFSCSPS